MLEVLGAAVDYRVGPELTHEACVRAAGGRGDGSAEVLGELEHDRTDPAGAGRDENSLPGLRPPALHQRVSCRGPSELSPVASTRTSPSCSPTTGSGASASCGSSLYLVTTDALMGRRSIPFVFVIQFYIHM